MILVVIGASGAGKTTIGRKLAAALDWPFHEGDDFHPARNLQRMKAGLPLGDAERAPWLKAIAASIAHEIGAGTSAVYACSALKRKYRTALVAPGAEASVRFVFLQASRAVLAERLAQRHGHFFPPQLLDSQLADLEVPAEGERTQIVSVDAAQPVAVVVQQILQALSLEGQASLSPSRPDPM